MKFSEKVREFRLQTNLPISDKPVLFTERQFCYYEKFVLEELEELAEAVEQKDLVGQTDALADMIYLLYGAMLMTGVPPEKVLNIVHEANMQKVAGANKRGPNDAAKPAGWIGPEKKIQTLIDELNEGEEDER